MPARNGNRARAVELLRQGFSYYAVAAQLKMARHTVSGYAAWARAQGINIPSRGAGRPYCIISALPVHVRFWLTEQVPNGCSVEDMIVAIIMDTYNEENAGD
jgi:transposase